MSSDYLIFDRQRVRAHRQRAQNSVAEADFLLKECAERLAERLLDINRMFPVALDLGAHHGVMAKYLPPSSGVETLVQSDRSEGMVRQAGGLKLAADEELLPFKDASFDLAFSVFSLHWINDLPGSLIQINRVLKPGGLMIVMIPGAETLKELRESFEQAELAVMGGISPRVSPFVDARDGGSLLGRSGFIEPVADSEIVNIHYATPMKLLNDLRLMGETNSLITRSKTNLKREVLMAATNYYQTHFSHPDGRVNATCEILTLTGWKKDA